MIGGGAGSIAAALREFEHRAAMCDLLVGECERERCTVWLKRRIGGGVHSARATVGAPVPAALEA